MKFFTDITDKLLKHRISFYGTELVKPVSTLTLAEKEAVKDAIFARQQEFATGRWCAKQAYRRFGVKSPQILIGQNKEPLWDSKFTGSISHTDDAYCAAVSKQKKYISIGLDIELRNKEISPEALDIIVNEDEKIWLNEMPENRCLYEKLILSSKETIFKLIFPITRKCFYFGAVTILKPRKNNELVAVLNQDLGRGFKAGKHIKIIYFTNEKWILTAAFRKNSRRITRISKFLLLSPLRIKIPTK